MLSNPRQPFPEVQSRIIIGPARTKKEFVSKRGKE